MKIYTRTGDAGDTGLFGGGRVPKHDPRVEAYGDVDELNATLGFVGPALEAAGSTSLLDRVQLLQAELFALGAHLATPNADSKAATHLPDLPREAVTRMEVWIDEAEARLEPLQTFILPGGTEAASRLHLARAVCRRAERRVTALAAAETIDPSIVPYLNRLSDLLFTWARLANRESGVGDIPWRGRR